MNWRCSLLLIFVTAVVISIICAVTVLVCVAGQPAERTLAGEVK